jgi:oxygen-dependent protoporphyrinogen oxidase
VSDGDGPTRRLVVVGGGITGLAAAWEASAHDDVEVTVLESSGRLGGKIITSALDLPTGPLVVDEGADAFLARVPDAVQLCEELGLADDLTQPRAGRARVWVGGRLRWFPEQHVLGVPVDLDDLAATGILSDAGLAAVRAERERDDPAPVADVSIGSFLAERFGPELVDHVVGPLVGGINAGDVHELSLRAVTPQLAEAAADGGSLSAALRRRRAATVPSGPVFRGLREGTGRLVDELASACTARGVRIVTGSAATSIRSVGPGDELRIGVGTGDDALPADAVVVTVAAPVAAGLVRDLSPTAAAVLEGIEHTPVAFVTLAFDRADVPVVLDASGLLVPRDAGLLLTATSWGSRKWAHWDDGRHVILRAAAGHRHDRRVEDLDDDELVRALRVDLTTTMGIVGTPVAARVTRWRPGFAQYTVGHLDRMARLHGELSAQAPALQVAGADLGGLGLPACIRQGREAARELLRPR